MILQYGWEPVLMKWILIGFEAKTGIILTKAQSLMNFGQDQFLSKFVLPGWVVNTRILGQVITQGFTLQINIDIWKK